MTNTGLRSIAVTYQVPVQLRTCVTSSQEFDSIPPHPNDPNKLADPPEDAPMVFVAVVGIKVGQEDALRLTLAGPSARGVP